MSIKKVTETTSSKILNSDIYDITRFVDDIKKKNIDGIDSSKETLLVGMYGYMGYQFASLLQNAIVTSSELSNEAIPTRAKFDRNVITHALSLGVKKVAATAANMKILLMFPEKALRANMIDGKFIFFTDYHKDLRYGSESDKGTYVKYHISVKIRSARTDTDKEYVIEFYANLVQDNEPDKIGLEYIVIKNSEGEKLWVGEYIGN